MTTPHQPQPHTDGWQPLMSPETYRVVMNNARSSARGDHKRKPNWSFAMHLFSCGSTFGWKHCEFAEIDPDGVSVGEIWRRPSTTQSQIGETDR